MNFPFFWRKSHRYQKVAAQQLADELLAKKVLQLRIVKKNHNSKGLELNEISDKLPKDENLVIVNDDNSTAAVYTEVKALIIAKTGNPPRVRNEIVQL